MYFDWKVGKPCDKLSMVNVCTINSLLWFSGFLCGHLGILNFTWLYIPVKGSRCFETGQTGFEYVVLQNLHYLNTLAKKWFT